MSTAVRPTRFVYALDCPDPVALAEFYAALLGWEVQLPVPDDADFGDPEWVAAVPPDVAPGGFSLGFQRVPNYRAPDWPEGPIPQQAHLDLWVDDVAAAEERALESGATRHAVQPSVDGGWIVFADPAGHLFCLCVA